MTWTIEAVAIGHDIHEQIDAVYTFTDSPTEHRIELAKVEIEKALWHSFSLIFKADPKRVEIHVTNARQEIQ